MSRPTIVGISGNLVRPSRTGVLADSGLSEAERRGLGVVERLDVLDAGPTLGLALRRNMISADVDRPAAQDRTARAVDRLRAVPGSFVNPARHPRLATASAR